MKVSLPTIFDCIFSGFIALLLSLVLFSSFLPHPYSVIISVVVALIFALFAFKFLYKNQQNNSLKKAEKAGLNLMLTQFNFSPDMENVEFFYKLFRAKGFSVERKRGGIFFKDKPAVAFIKFGFSPVSKSDVVKYFNLLRKDDVGYIISDEFSAEILSFISRFDDRLKPISGGEIYKYLKEKNALPKARFQFVEKKQKGLKILRNLLYKNKAKNYLVFGLVFLLMSYFFSYKIYYIVVGVIFLISALLARLFGVTDKKKSRS